MRGTLRALIRVVLSTMVRQRTAEISVRMALDAAPAGVLVVLVVAFVVELLHKDIPVTHEMMARTDPNVLDLMIALAGGAAGA